MSRSPTTTDPEWLHNPHAGEMLWSEFMEPLGITTSRLGEELRMPASRIESMITGSIPVDGDLDLRLSRYFRMSEGFFLRLQNSYDLMEAKRANGDELDRIVPRPA